MFAENKILIDQATILENIIEYEAKRYLEDNNKSRSFIDQFFGKDYRFGISFLWAYTRWLQTQPKADNPNDPKASKPRNDYDWFKSTIELINSWNTKKELEEKETLIFERFISLVQYFQHVDSHLPIDQDAVNQILEDTNNRNLKKEYAIASLLTLEQLKQLLKTKNIVQDGKLILINSHNRTTALFKEGEKYYYFDPSNRIGEVQVDSIDKVAKLIFDTNFYTVSGGTYKIISTKSAYIKGSIAESVGNF